MPSSGANCSFGPFQLFPAERTLLRDGSPVRIGGRAFDILAALAQRPGEILSKAELTRLVWPDIFVDEGNLRVNIAALQKVLGRTQDGRRYIANVPGRGYSLVFHAEPVRLEAPTNLRLPIPLASIIGRDADVERATSLLGQHRLVTIAGPGGIGKTTVAVAAAWRIATEFQDGVYFISLASVASASLVPSALATVLRVPVLTEEPTEMLIEHLRTKRALILLDGCEHVVAATATLAEALLKSAAFLRILATSREPLRAEGERLSRLAPLEIPGKVGELGAREALRFSAVELFADRAAAVLDDFELHDGIAHDVVTICRRLDGIPLAIELAAARLDLFSVQALAKEISNLFEVLTVGRRTALPHHQTLRAALDWSYAFLSPEEQNVLSRLAVIPSLFGFKAALAIASADEKDGPTVTMLFSSLVAKSLISVTGQGLVTRYCLLDTMRAYALEKLASSDERQEAARRHALYVLGVMEIAAGDHAGYENATLDDLRAALDWAFSECGDVAIGRRLLISGSPFWYSYGLMEECRSRVQGVLDDPTQRFSERLEMELQSALGHALVHSRGPSNQTEQAFSRALELAETLGEVEMELRALWNLWFDRMSAGEYPISIRIGERFGRLSSSSDNAAYPTLHHRMMALALHFHGDQDEALQHVEAVLTRPNVIRGTARDIGFHFDQRVAVRVVHSRLLWIQGKVDQARSLASEAVRIGSDEGHVISICYAISVAHGPIAVWTGDFVEARRTFSLLVEYASKNSLDYWLKLGRCIEAAIELNEGRGSATAGFVSAPSLAHQIDLLPTFSWRFLNARAIERAQRGDNGWCIAEIFRAQGDAAFQNDELGAAEAQYVRALAHAQERGELSWALRAGISLGRLYGSQGRIKEAISQVAAVRQPFTEGFETADLQESAKLLDQLSEARLKGLPVGPAPLPS